MALDPVFDAAEINRRKAVEAKRLQERQKSDLRKVLSSAEGRRFVWRVIGEAGVFKGSFTGNSETFFREGKRDMGLFVLNDILKSHPDAFAQMQREAASDRLLQESDQKKAEQGDDHGE